MKITDNTKNLTFIALMTAFICILGPLSIPIGPVPVSLQNFAIYLALYIVGMNPKNGDVLGITGKKKKFDGNFQSNGVEDDALGAINNSFGMGSVVKPATVLSGYMDGALTLEDNKIVDEPIEFEASKQAFSTL